MDCILSLNDEKPLFFQPVKKIFGTPLGLYAKRTIGENIVSYMTPDRSRCKDFFVSSNPKDTVPSNLQLPFNLDSEHLFGEITSGGREIVINQEINNTKLQTIKIMLESAINQAEKIFKNK